MISRVSREGECVRARLQHDGVRARDSIGLDDRFAQRAIAAPVNPAGIQASYGRAAWSYVVKAIREKRRVWQRHHDLRRRLALLEDNDSGPPVGVHAHSNCTALPPALSHSHTTTARPTQAPPRV